jgi:hypothetical protein
LTEPAGGHGFTSWLPYTAAGSDIIAKLWGVPKHMFNMAINSGFSRACLARQMFWTSAFAGLDAKAAEIAYSMSPESGHRFRDKDMRKNKELKRLERI